jgi:hypothetical protein
MNELDRAGPAPRPTSPASGSRGIDGISWLYGVALLILAFAVARLWLMPPTGPAAPAGLDALVQQFHELEVRVARLEGRPVPDAGAMRALADRVDALEQRSLEPRIAALEQKAVTAGSVSGAAAGASTGAPAVGEPELVTQLARDRTRLDMLAHVEVAQLALAQGRPLGDWPDAPAALKRFSGTPPPTEATLRLTFEAAAQAALANRRSTPSGEASVWQRALARIESLVTVREGDQVLLGNPAAGTIAHARHALDAGDLAGALDALKSLPPAAADAFAGWMAQAQALLEARNALSALAASG